MKKLLFTLFVVAGVFSITLIYSCKKNDSATATNPGTGGATLDTSSQTFNDDANYYKSESDQINSDVNTDLNNYSSLQGRMAQGGGGNFQTGYQHPCGCNNPDTSNLHSAIPTIVYHFDGVANCWGRTRSGTITVQLTSGTKWSDVGAVLTFSTTDYTVTRMYGNHKSITFSGTKTLKNVNGSSFIQWLSFLAGTGTIKLQERALSVNVTFSGGLHATWNSADTTTWTYNPGTQLITYTGIGDTTIAGVNSTYAWGTDRYNQSFITHFTAPIVCNSSCGYAEPLSGQWIHNVNNSTLTVTYGVNQDGSLHTGSGCPWGFSVAWVLANSNGTADFIYY